MSETEIKFIVEDFACYRTQLTKKGAVKKAQFFEDNIVFDNEIKSLFRKKQLLRLRKGDKITLTFKHPVEISRFKIMKEYEVEVSDFDTARKIINSLGYKKTFRYQKNREIYSFENVLILLDETPIGNIIEIEGSRENIERAAEALGLDINRGMSKNYMELYAEYCRKNNLKPSDMIFCHSHIQD